MEDDSLLSTASFQHPVHNSFPSHSYDDTGNYSQAELSTVSSAPPSVSPVGQDQTRDDYGEEGDEVEGSVATAAGESGDEGELDDEAFAAKVDSELGLDLPTEYEMKKSREVLVDRHQGLSDLGEQIKPERSIPVRLCARRMRGSSSYARIIILAWMEGRPVGLASLCRSAALLYPHSTLFVRPGHSS